LIRATWDFADDEIRCARWQQSALKLFAYLDKPEVIGAQSERRDGTAPHVRNSSAGSVLCELHHADD
jgi:hypothetical protein